MIDYLRDPAEIYRRSFETIRREADLGPLPPTLHDVAVRLMHACGMTDIARDLAFSPDVASAARDALRGGGTVLVDAEMVRHGITHPARAGGSCIVCALNDDAVPAIASRDATTRSAAAVELWTAHLAGAVVAIGNAPTALFRLLELLDAGAPKPAAILAFPVGFVGAVESKAELARDPRGVPFLTLLGRRGGSAMAAAAVNALAGAP
ncbi:MAG: precorrin-8X methylmutase [Rhodospirillales bacterium]|nr:precorrin-8X methylmutase [Rhodospirillales bacterium]